LILRRFLAVSAVGVSSKENPAVVSWSWVETGLPVAIPWTTKRVLPHRRWNRVRTAFPGIIRSIRNIVLDLGGIDLVAVDITRNKIDALSLALGHLVAGAARCSRLKFVQPTKWASVLFGPEAALALEDQSFDSLIVNAIAASFPRFAGKVTCPQPARATGLLCWLASRYGGEKLICLPRETELLQP
jgi:hypothetical protein